jgi:hypothetical protein
MERVVLSVLSALGLLALLPSTAHATYYPIETTSVDLANDGLCSLREAIQASNTLTAVNGADDCPAGTGDDSIFLPAGTYTSSVKLTVTRTLHISSGGMPSATTIKTSDGYALSELFSVSSGASLTLQSLTVQKGSGTAQTRGIYGLGYVSLEQVVVTGFTRSGIYIGDAAAIGGGLSLYQTVVKNNSTQTDGGGIYNGLNQALFIENSTINNNTALGKGGGIHHRGWGNSNIYQTTVSDNSAARGGGIYNNATGSGGNYFSLHRMTIAGNSASVSGGGVVEDATTNNFFNVYTSIIADNTGASNPNVDGEVLGIGCYFGTITAGASIIDGGGTPNVSGVTSAQLKLGPLLDMGGWFGSTPVRPLLKGSTAIDYDANVSSDDQRQIDTQDGDNNGTSKQDVGAYETNLLWENEIHGYQASSDMTEIDVDSGYSGFGGFTLHADAVDDYLTLPMYFAESGTYTVTIRAKRATNGGRFKVGTSTSTSGFSEFGTTIDLYSSSTSFTTVSLGTRAFNAGKYYFRYRVTGKAASSSGYQLYPDYIKVVKN